jgi:hypothetical protein
LSGAPADGHRVDPHPIRCRDRDSHDPIGGANPRRCDQHPTRASIGSDPVEAGAIVARRRDRDHEDFVRVAVRLRRREEDSVGRRARHARAEEKIEEKCSEIEHERRAVPEVAPEANTRPQATEHVRNDARISREDRGPPRLRTPDKKKPAGVSPGRFPETGLVEPDPVGKPQSTRIENVRVVPPWSACCVKVTPFELRLVRPTWQELDGRGRVGPLIAVTGVVLVNVLVEGARHDASVRGGRALTRTAVHRTVELVRDFAVEGDVDVVAGRVPRLLTSAEKLRDGDRGEDADDRDHDQKLDQGKALAIPHNPSLLCRTRGVVGSQSLRGWRLTTSDPALEQGRCHQARDRFPECIQAAPRTSRERKTRTMT